MAKETCTKKCGIIWISFKKNRMVNSFQCWFCDTICMEIKKFTLHIKQNHEKHLLAANSPSEYTNDFTPEVELEEESCLRSVEDEEPHVFPKVPLKTQNSLIFDDPLKTNGIEEKVSLQKNGLAALTDYEVDVPICDTDINFLPDNEDEGDIDEHFDLSNDEKLSFMTNISEESADEILPKPLKNEVIISLLKIFKETPQFWGSPQKTSFNLNEKSKPFQVLVEKLNKQLKIKLTPNQVKKTLNSLRQQHEQNMETNHSNTDEEKFKLWFYEHMAFSKNSIKYSFKDKPDPKQRLKSLENEQFSILIDIYKNFNLLWDVNNLGFPIKAKRNEALQAMLTEVNNKLNLKLNTSKLGQHLSYVHQMFAQDKKQRLECEHNQQPFKPSYIFYDKCGFLESNQGPFRCSTCEEILDSYNDFRRHVSSHDGSMAYVCPDCGMGFKKKSYYSTHVKRHLGIFKFHCNICGKGYPFNAELEEHKRSHTGAQPFLCSICGESFGRASTYDNHVRRHEERFKYLCEICKRGFNCATRLKDHVKAHLNVRDSICPVCGKAFTSRRLLSQHKRIHASKTCICNVCGKAFASEIGLRAHKKYHGSNSLKLNDNDKSVCQ